MVSHWGLSDKSPKVSRTLLSLRADLYNTAVWMVSTCPFIPKSISFFTNPLGIVPSAQLQLLSPSFSCSVVFFSSLLTIIIIIICVCGVNNRALDVLSPKNEY